jgi:hypothetical protein
MDERRVYECPSHGVWILDTFSNRDLPRGGKKNTAKTQLCPYCGRWSPVGGVYTSEDSPRSLLSGLEAQLKGVDATNYYGYLDELCGGADLILASAEVRSRALYKIAMERKKK